MGSGGAVVLARSFSPTLRISFCIKASWASCYEPGPSTLPVRLMERLWAEAANLRRDPHRGPVRNTAENHTQTGGCFLLKHHLPNECQWTLLLKEHLLGESHVALESGGDLPEPVEDPAHLLPHRGPTAPPCGRPDQRPGPARAKSFRPLETSPRAPGVLLSAGRTVCLPDPRSWVCDQPGIPSPPHLIPSTLY